MADNNPPHIPFDFTSSPEDFTSLAKTAEAKRERIIANSESKARSLAERQRQHDLANIEYSRSQQERSAGEVLGDTGLAIGQGAVDLGGVAYGVTDLASRLHKYSPLGLAVGAAADATDVELPGSLDEATGGFSQNFNEASEIIGSLKSDPTQYAQEKVAQANTERAADKEARIDQAIVEGDSFLGAYGKELLGDAGVAVEALADNPLAAFDSAIRSIPQLFVGGAAGKGAVKLAVRKATPEAGKKFLASKAGQKAAEKIATKAGVSTTAVQEGIGNALDAKASVLDMSHEELMEGSPTYQQLIEGGVSEAKAKQEISNNVFDMTAAIAGTIGAVTAKVTGAAKFEGNLFLPGTKLGGIINSTVAKIAGNTTTETVEESLQGAAGQFASNIATQTYADESQTLTEGVGAAAGEGAVVGGLAGGAVSTATTIPKKAVETVDTVRKKISADIQDRAINEATINEVAETGDVASVTDVNAEDFNVNTTMGAILKRNQTEGVTSEEKEQNIAEAVRVLEESLAKAKTEPTTPEEVAAKNKQQKELELAFNKFAAIQEAATLKDDEINALIQEGTEQSVDRVLGSMRIDPDSVTEAQADAILSDTTGIVTPAQKEELALHKEYVAATKSMGEVRTDVVTGSPDGSFKGVNQYKNSVNSALTLGNISKAQQEATSLRNFAQQRVEKARAVAKAYAPFQVAKEAGKRYTPTPEHQADIDFVASNYKTLDGKPLKIHSGTPVKLVKAVADEANIVTKGLAQVEQRIATAKDVAPTETVNPEVVGETVENEVSEVVEAQPVATPETELETVSSTSGREAQPTEVTPTPEPLTTEEAVVDPVPDEVTTEEDVEQVGRKKAVSGDQARGMREDIKNLERRIQAINLNDEFAEQETDALQREIDAIQQQLDDALPGVAEQYNLAEKVISQGNVTELNEESTAQERIDAHYADNLIAKHFTARPVDELVGSENALVNEPNLFEQLQEGEDVLGPYLGQEEGITPEQLDNLNKLKSFHTELRKSFGELFKVNTPSKSGKLVRYQEFMQYFVDENGQVDENVISSLIVGAYEWVATSARDTVINDDLAINRILGKPDDARVTSAQYEELSEAGVLKNNLINSLGNSIFPTLGMQVNKSAPANIKSQLVQALGSMAVGMLLDTGYLKAESIKVSRITALASDGTSAENALEGETDKIASVVFYRVPTEVLTEDGVSKAVPTLNVRSISDEYKKAPNLINTLFSVQTTRTGPTLDKPTAASTVSTVKGTGQNIPKDQRDIISKHEQTEHFIKQGVFDVYSLLRPTQQLQMEGFVEDVETTISVANRKAVLAKNNALVRGHEYLVDFVEQAKGNPFYFTHELWKTGRLGMVSNTFNMQGSSLHRHFAKQAGWDTEVDLNDETSEGNFLLAFGESFGVDTDKENRAASLPTVRELIKDPVVVAGANAVNEIQGDISDERKAELQDAIMAAVDKGKEGAYSFDGLVNLAQMFKAQAESKSTFNSDLFREVDGVNNGLIIGTLQLSAGSSYQDMRNKLNAGGLFFDGITSDFGEYLEKPENLDNYQQIAVIWGKAVNALARTASPKKRTKIAAVQKLFGTLVDNQGNVTGAGRKLAKDPIVTTMYGSGDKSVKASLFNNLVTKVYESIEAAVAIGGQAGMDALIELQTDLNTAAGQEVISFTGLDSALGVTLSKKSLQVLEQSVNDSYGDTLVATLDTGFGNFKKKGSIINASLNRMFMMFNALYQAEVTKAEEAMYVSGELIKGVTTLPESKRAEIIAELKEAMPIVDNFFSQKNQDVDEGMLFISDAQEFTRDQSHEALTTFNRPPKNAPKNVKTGNPVNRISTRGKLKVLQEPGVSGAVGLVQAIDAATMMTHLAESEALNVHDAIIVGQDGALDQGAKMNDDFLTVNREYSILRSVSDAFERATTKLKQYDTDNGTNYYQEISADILGDLPNDVIATDGIEYTQSTLKDVQESADKIKHDNLDALTMGAQYYVSGGELLTPKNEPQSLEDAIQDIYDGIPIEPALGSTFEGIDPNEFTDPSIAVSDLNATQVFDQLNTLGTIREDKAHQTFLRELVDGMSNKIIEPINLFMRDSQNTETQGATSSRDIFILNQVQGTLPKISGMLANGIRMSTQEVYSHELVHVITRGAVDKQSLAAKRLRKLHALVKRELDTKYGKGKGYMAFMSDKALLPTDANYSVEVEAAQARYDHIFNIRGNRPQTVIDKSTGLENTTQTADYMHELMAFGMTNAAFRAELESINSTLTNDDIFTGNLLEVVTKLFQWFVDALSARLFTWKGATARAELDSLFVQLAGADARNKSTIEKQINAGLNAGTAQLNALIVFTKNQLVKASKLPAIEKSKYALVRAPAAVIGLVANDRAEYFIPAIRDIRKDVQRGQQGIISSMVTEMIGRTMDNAKFYDLNRVRNMTVDQQRKLISETVSKTLLGEYKGELTPLQKIAISKGIVKTDLVSLTDTYTLPELEELLNPADDSNLDVEVAKLKTELNAFGSNTGFYKRAAKSLGHYMATGNALEQHHLMNAGKIVNLSGTGTTAPSAETVAKAEAIIDKLASLYAIQFTDNKYRVAVSEVMRSELARTDGNYSAVENGITFTLHQHRALQEDAKASLFADSDDMVKGYTKEIVNPHVSVIYAPASEAKNLAKQLYTTDGIPLPRDPADPNKVQMFRYVSKHMGMKTYAEGIASRTSRTHKGSDTIDLRTQTGVTDAVKRGVSDVQQLQKAKAAAIQEMFVDREVSPADIKTPLLIPVTNPQGDVVQYRYVMSEGAKDGLLEKHNEFQDVLGGMAGSIVDKVATETINDKVVKALYEQYKEDTPARSNEYLEIGPNSTDKRLREIYYSLPAEARQSVKQVWGGKRMYVRTDLIDLVFGYRKYSISDMWDKDSDEVTLMEQAFMRSMDFVLRGKAAGRLRVMEDIWQTIIKEMKDIIVIKSGVVTAVNTVSNTVSLRVLGVPLKDALRDQAEALTGAVKYQADRKELLRLEKVIEFNHSPTTRSEDSQRINELKNELANNPTRELIEAGVFQTIVEDVDGADLGFSYKSKASGAVDKITGRVIERIPTGVTKFAKNMVMTHDTPTYRAMNQLAQLSDFSARYALHKHYTTRAVNPLSKEDSIAKIVSIFVDYDLPTHKAIQYGNDMGFIWFSKYNLRIQRILLETMRERPAAMLMAVALQGMFMDVPDMSDGAFTANSPLNMIRSPLDNMDLIGDIAPISIADSLVN